MTSAPKNILVLAVHPTTRGFGWALFERPGASIDWGIASAKAGRDARIISRFERLLKRYQPTMLVLEAFERSRAERAKELYETFMHLAHCKDMPVHVFEKTAVNATFGLRAAATRHDLCKAVAEKIDALRHRLPPKRKPWVAEDSRQSLFVAAALALAYFARSET
ncbi:MAG: hypothetical protein WDM89_22130 [Rhizomicrobium sp.]